MKALPPPVGDSPPLTQIEKQTGSEKEQRERSFEEIVFENHHWTGTKNHVRWGESSCMNAGDIRQPLVFVVTVTALFPFARLSDSQ